MLQESFSGIIFLYFCVWKPDLLSGIQTNSGIFLHISYESFMLPFPVLAKGLPTTVRLI